VGKVCLPKEEGGLSGDNM